MRYVLENRLLGDGKISKMRKVQVLDVDECTYTGNHAEVCYVWVADDVWAAAIIADGVVFYAMFVAVVVVVVVGSNSG